MTAAIAGPTTPNPEKLPNPIVKIPDNIICRATLDIVAIANTSVRPNARSTAEHT